jgi:hypothetical protein
MTLMTFVSLNVSNQGNQNRFINKCARKKKSKIPVKEFFVR